MRKLLILFFTSFYLNSNSQVVEKLILGQWDYVKIDSDSSQKNIESLNHSNSGISITFFKNFKFVTKKSNNNNSIVLGEGIYSFSSDKKYLYQNGNQILIKSITKERLILIINDGKRIELKRKIITK